MAIAKRTWRKIALGSAIGLIAALIIMIVAMAAIPVGFFPKVNEKQDGVFDFTSVHDFEVRKGSQLPFFGGDPTDADKVDDLAKILNTWRSSFSATFLSASTNGAAGKSFKLEDFRSGFSSTYATSIFPNYAYSIELRFSFSPSAGRTLYHANGEVAYSNDQRNSKGEIINPSSLEEWKVYGVIIGIPEGGGFDKMDIYFITSTENSQNPLCRVVMRVYANYNKLFKVIDEFANETGSNP